jgi:hypothetical protein
MRPPDAGPPHTIGAHAGAISLLAWGGPPRKQFFTDRAAGYGNSRKASLSFVTATGRPRAWLDTAFSAVGPSLSTRLGPWALPVKRVLHPQIFSSRTVLKFRVLCFQELRSAGNFQENLSILSTKG